MITTVFGPSFLAASIANHKHARHKSPFGNNKKKRVEERRREKMRSNCTAEELHGPF
jgi:hypothetical protein